MHKIPSNLKNWYERTNIGLFRSSIDQKITVITSIKSSCEKIILNHQNNNDADVIKVVEIEKNKVEILEQILDVLMEG